MVDKFELGDIVRVSLYAKNHAGKLGVIEGFLGNRVKLRNLKTGMHCIVNIYDLRWSNEYPPNRKLFTGSIEFDIEV